MQNNKTADQQLNSKTAVPEELLELAPVLLQCKVCAVYSVLTLLAPTIFKNYLLLCLRKERVKDLSELILTGFPVSHYATRPSGGSSKAHCVGP